MPVAEVDAAGVLAGNEGPGTSMELRGYKGKCRTRAGKRSRRSWRMQDNVRLVLKHVSFRRHCFRYLGIFLFYKVSLWDKPHYTWQMKICTNIETIDLQSFTLKSRITFCLPSSWRWGINVLILFPGALLDFSNFVRSRQIRTCWYN